MNELDSTYPRPFIDGHAHLAEMEDGQSAIDEAREEGLTAIVAVGMDLDSNFRTLRIAEANRGFVLPAIGYHPWSLKSSAVKKTLAFIEEHINAAVALGEVGLDVTANTSGSLQEEVFAAILTMARRHDKALILHGLKAQERVYSLLREHGISKAVFHWYADSLDLLRDILAAGYLISATPALLYSPPHQAAIREAPLNRIILETDCPERYRDFLPRSRPRDLVITSREVARVKGLPVDEVMRQTSENVSELLGISRLAIGGDDR